MAGRHADDEFPKLTRADLRPECHQRFRQRVHRLELLPAEPGQRAPALELVPGRELHQRDGVGAHASRTRHQAGAQQHGAAARRRRADGFNQHRLRHVLLAGSGTGARFDFLQSKCRAVHLPPVDPAARHQ